MGLTETRKKELTEQVKAVIVETLKVDINKVLPESSFTGDLGADSLDTVDLVMALEEAFSVEFAEEDSQKIITVEDAINYVIALEEKKG
jgi:acyl carrier protein